LGGIAVGLAVEASHLFFETYCPALKKPALEPKVRSMTDLSEVPDVPEKSSNKDSYDAYVARYLDEAGPYGVLAILRSWIDWMPETERKLLDAKRWKPEQFFKRIKTRDDALRFAAQMFESMGNPLNYFFYGPELKFEDALFESRFLGTGIVFYRFTDACGLVCKSRRGQVLPKQNTAGYPIVCRVVPGSDADKVGFRAGDVVTAINGVSTKSKPLAWLVDNLNGSPGKHVTIRRLAKKERDVCEQKSVPLGVSHKSIGDIGYIKINTFYPYDVPERVAEAVSSFSDSRGLIIDLRGTWGGRTAVCAQTTSVFLTQGKLFTTDLNFQGRRFLSEYVLTSGAVKIEEINGDIQRKDRQPNLWLGKPLVILIDEDTRSAPETFTKALTDNGCATTVGTRSFGKGIVQHLQRLQNIAELDMTIGKWFSPKGTWIGDGGNHEPSGIIPDHFQEFAGGCLFGDKADSQLTKALEILKA
jgi:C-terminal peptidase prc